MPLSTILRGSLEEIIDNEVKFVPDLVTQWRNSEAKTQYQITNIEDFVYGYTLSSIQGQFANLIMTVERRLPTDEEIDESKFIVFKRLPELRNAIFNAG